jgi:hypothetical protein
MTKMNIGAWIGIVGGIAGILIAISAVNMVAGSSAPYITAGIVIVFGGMFFLFYKLLFGPMINAARLMRMGTPGKAVIKEVKDTGVTVNNSPQVKLILEVRNSYGQKYEATVRTLVSRINPFVFQPGMEVPVMIDPKNDQNVIINTAAAAAPARNVIPQTAAVDESALRSEIGQLQQENESIGISGRPARAIVKKYTWLGSYVNGQNPYVELEVEVLPEHSSSFSARTRGVIAEASVPKFQPGSEIHVKYDFYDNSKVVIDRSN